MTSAVEQMLKILVKAKRLGFWEVNDLMQQDETLMLRRNSLVASIYNPVIAKDQEQRSIDYDSEDTRVVLEEAFQNVVDEYYSYLTQALNQANN